MNNFNTLKEFYEKDAIRFSSFQKTGVQGRDAIIATLIPICRDKKSSIFLEYGFGNGNLLCHFASLYEKAIGYEISTSLIKELRKIIAKRNIHNITLFESNDTTLSQLDKQSVDTIACSSVLQHVINPYAVLDEFYRVAKNDAKLIVSVPNIGYLKHRVRLVFGKIPKMGTNLDVKYWRETGWNSMHLHFFTKGAFEILLNDTGWIPLSWHGWGYKLPKLRNLNPGLLSGEIIAVCNKRI